MSDRSATGWIESFKSDLTEFRRGVGRSVLFVSPVGGRIERGTIVGVDRRMVYVDGYPNPIEPALGNAIATHPSNLRMENTAAQHSTQKVYARPVFSDASSR